MAKNIIFVDIDGPLLPGKLHLIKQNRKTGKDNPPVFDQFAVTAFNLWAKYGNAKIVFSTNWALSYTDVELKDIMEVNGLVFDYHEEVTTPKRFSSSYRHNEILDWLSDYSEEGDRFIAVDDDTSCEWIEKLLEGPEASRSKIPARGEWIQVDFTDGMTYENFLDGCKALGIEIADINEQEYGVKKLTQEEKDKRDKALELLTSCIC